MTPSSPQAASRRQFLQRLASFCLAAAGASAGGAIAPTRDADLMKARAAAQWSRIDRGLDAKTMAACRQAAGNLAPRLTSLLAQADWEARILKSVADELKKLGVYPDRAPILDPACAKEAEADRLRSEAASTRPFSNSTATSIVVAGAIVATIPGVGPIIAAVLMLIAAVISLLAQIAGKEQEDKSKKKSGYANLLKLQDALLVKLEPLPDCYCFGKKVKGTS